jgi:PAS domain S-box-containing protein
MAPTEIAKIRKFDRRQQLELLIQNLGEYAIYMLDADGFVSTWSPGARRIQGYEEAEIVGQHYSRFFSDDDQRQAVPQKTLEIARSTGHYGQEGWRVRQDGQLFWASVVTESVRDETGEIIGFAEIARDSTDRNNSREALQDSERQFRLLVSAVIDYALFMLDPNGVVISWNAGAEKIKGYKSSEIIGKHFSRFYTEQDRAAGIPNHALRTANQEGRFEGEGLRVRKDGTVFWANVVIDAIRDERGHLVGFAKITRDITERRENQLALQRAQEQLAQSQKMEALGQLTGGIAHDFNNLLTIIVGQARILKSAVSDPKGVKAIEGIETTVQRGASLTRQLLGFSRRQQLDPQPVSLSERLPGLQALLSRLLPSNVGLTATIPSGTWAVMADPNELELAIMNLVINARDAMPSGGAITVVAENLVLDGQNPLQGLSGEFVALSVRDTGTGIAKDVLSKVFDPFFTTKSYGKGTGLGLSQVYGFAHQTGGSVTIDSEIDKGTRVTMLLPRSPIGETHDAPPLEEASRERKPARILIIEDNPDVTEVTAALVAQLGYTVRIAPNPETAMTILDEEELDLIFSDIMMPGKLDGIEFAHHVRRVRPALPILLASGSNKRVEQAQTHFMTLQKPYELPELDRAIQQLLYAGSESANGRNAPVTK